MGHHQALFVDRADAGRVLAATLDGYRDRHDVLVLALPRGGVPVGYEVAKRLRARLDVIVVRKLGFPEQPELAMGAIAPGGIRVLDHRVVDDLGVTAGVLDRVVARETAELERRERLYRGDLPPADPSGMTAIVVDDGIATGSSMRAAIASIRARDAARVIVAVPVAPPAARRELSSLADGFLCVAEPLDFRAVSQWYADFGQTSDEEVRRLLAQAALEAAAR